MRALAAILAALALVGCFKSEQALFSKCDAVVPIRDGAIYEFRSSGQGDPLRLVRFTRVGDAYEMRPLVGDEPPARLMFASIIQTHDDDYIAQFEFRGKTSGGFVYAFLWPLGDDRYQVYAQTDRLDSTGQATSDRCAELLFGCSFDSADDMRRYYLDVLYPILSSGRRPTATYTEMIPVDPTAPPVESTHQ